MYYKLRNNQFEGSVSYIKSLGIKTMHAQNEKYWCLKYKFEILRIWALIYIFYDSRNKTCIFIAILDELQCNLLLVGGTQHDKENRRNNEPRVDDYVLFLLLGCHIFWLMRFAPSIAHYHYIQKDFLSQ